MKNISTTSIVLLAVTAVLLIGYDIRTALQPPQVQTIAGAATELESHRVPSQDAPEPSQSRIGPPELYPDPIMTPGAWDTTDAGNIQKRWPCPSGVKSNPKDGKCTYSQAHRNVSTAEKTAVYAEYEKLHPGITHYCHVDPKRCEVDHDIPVGGGGANSIKNLWVQRADVTWNSQTWGFHQKDDLESFIIAQEKAGRLDPLEADNCISNDWVQCYMEMRPPHSNETN